MKELFGKYGNITSMVVRVDANLKKPFAFICFENHETAQKVIEEMNGKVLPGQTDPIHVGWAQTKHERARAFAIQERQAKNETKIYIRDIKVDTTVTMLNEVLSNFGEIESSSVKTVNHVGGSNPLKFAMCNFKTKEAAQNALIQGPMSDALKAICDVPSNGRLYIKMAQTRAMREKFMKLQKRNQAAKLQSQMMGMGNPFNPKAMQMMMGGQGMHQMQMMMMQFF